MKDRARRKELTGVILSGKMEKTLIVRVGRTIKHPLYKKRIRKYKRFKVHDEKNEGREGQKVKIMETRPLSKEKRWRLVEVIK
ncbi:MAG: 30S ribosomal protein S17 [Candidatus Kaelpia imicola]|nr:30S ribosomal protein S17 [Candidatus Kaelpia imicola]